MEAGIKALLVIGGVIFWIVAIPILGAAGGAFTAIVVNWVFPDGMSKLIAWTGQDFAPYQLGAMLGFVGGFLKTRTTVSQKS